MYSAKIVQVNLPINNILSVIEQENGPAIDVVIQSEVSLLTNQDRKVFYKSYNRHNEDQRIPHNNRKVLRV